MDKKMKIKKLYTLVLACALISLGFIFLSFKLTIAEPQIVEINNKGNATFIKSGRTIFSWTIEPDTSQYHVEVSTDNIFASLIVNISDINSSNYPDDYSINSTHVTFQSPASHAITDSGKYYTRVRAYVKER